MSLLQRAQRARTPTPCIPQRRLGDLQRDHCASAQGERCPPTGAYSSRPPPSSHAQDPHRCVSVPEKSWGCRAGAPRVPCLAQQQRGVGRHTAGSVALDRAGRAAEQAAVGLRDVVTASSPYGVKIRFTTGGWCRVK